MSTVVVGSIALDSVETPYGTTKDALGGTAVFFSMAARCFTDVSIVGVVGSDFPDAHLELLALRGCNLEGLRKVPGRTFRWTGRYDQNMNVAHTLATELNVFEDFTPHLPVSYVAAETVFLGNIDPDLQADVLSQLASPSLVGLDTMNFWIEGKREAVESVMRRVDIVLVNEDEARQFSGVYRIFDAARFILELGPKVVVIKRGEYGAALFTRDQYFALPSYPTTSVKDTTGAGDSFAGGFLGHLDSVAKITPTELRRALAFGTVAASFTVEDFSVHALHPVEMPDLVDRFEQLRRLTAIEPVENMAAVESLQPITA